MGTLHQGSSIAGWGSKLDKLLNVVRRVDRENAKTLETLSPILKTVEEDFQKLLLRPEYRDQIRIFTFYKEAAVTRVGFIVPKDSAQPKQYTSKSLHANHMNMTKFSSDSGPGYVAVCAQLQA
jgi:protein SERAC1